jgi:hypothetical protein
MVTLNATRATLLDLAQRQDPDGKIAPIVELLHQSNEFLTDAFWKEGNLITGNRTTVRTGLPTPTWRKMYGGVQPTKSITAQVTDNCGMLEAYSEIDKALADLNNNTAAFRLSEDTPHIEGISQELASTFFYGDEASAPNEFTGLAPRYNDLSAANADNIVVGGGSDVDNASIWLVGWGENTVHGIVPKGSTAGIQFSDKGQVTVENIDGSNGRMEAYRSHYRIDAGLTVRDWRYVVRIPNIDKSALSSVYDAGVFATSSAHLPELMFQAMRLIPNLSVVRPAFYMSRDIMTWVDRQVAAAVQGSTLTTDMVGGKLVTSFHGIPMRRVDALAADEALVT